MLRIMLKVVLRSVELTKKMLRKRKALNHVTFGKLLIIILAFWLFLLVNFVSLDAPTTADVPGFGKILKRMPNCVQ